MPFFQRVPRILQLLRIVQSLISVLPTPLYRRKGQAYYSTSAIAISQKSNNDASGPFTHSPDLQKAYLGLKYRDQIREYFKRIRLLTFCRGTPTSEEGAAVETSISFVALISGVV